MSITIFKQSASVSGLQDEGVVARPLTQPAARIAERAVGLEGAGDNRCGLWECTPGRFERQLAEAEVMHILSGACTFTPVGGEPLDVRAGDTLFFPSKTRGVWDIRETVRKVYVVMTTG